MHLGLLHPSLTLIVGNSQSGKSTLTIRIVKEAERLFAHHFDHLVWIYQAGEASCPRKELAHIRNLSFLTALPEDFSTLPKNALIICDDCDTENLNSSALLHVALKGSHHSNQSIIILLHNLFTPGKVFRTISLQAQYYCIFRSLRDKSQIDHFLRQFSPSQWREYRAIYNKFIADQAYEHLWFDANPASPLPAPFRVRSHILPSDTAVQIFCKPVDLHHALQSQTTPQEKSPLPPNFA